MPTRRSLLGTVGAGSLALTAGCAYREDPDPGEPVPIQERLPNLPVEENVEVLAAGIEAGFDADVADPAEFEQALTDAGLAVESLVDREDELALEYRDEPERDSGVLRDIGVVAGAYAALLDGTAGLPGRLLATLVDDELESFGEYHVDAEWAVEYAAGETSAEEYGVLVSDTLETIV